MKRPVLESWAGGDSFLHRRHAAVKLIAVLVLLAAISTSGAGPVGLLAGFGVPLAVGVALSGLPPAGLLKRVLMVMAFSISFSAAAWMTAGPGRGAVLLSKSALSALSILLLAGTTPMHRILDTMGRLGAPSLLVEVAQYLYRYLFVIAGKAVQMRHAAACRGGWRWGASAGAAAALFGASYTRAENVRRAMLSRGAAGIANTAHSPATAADFALGGVLVAYIAGARLAWNL